MTTDVEKVLNDLVNEYGTETFVSEGYAYYDSAKAAFMKLLSSRDAEVEELRADLYITQTVRAAQGVRITELRAKLRDASNCIETILYAHLGGHLNPNDTGKNVLNSTRETLAKLRGERGMNYDLQPPV